jgi:hypothetical protein
MTPIRHPPFSTLRVFEAAVRLSVAEVGVKNGGGVPGQHSASQARGAGISRLVNSAYRTQCELDLAALGEAVALVS